MKVAILNPSFIFTPDDRNFNGYNIAFLRNHAKYIFLSNPLHYYLYKKELKKKAIKCKILTSKIILNRKADVLLSFNGQAFKKENVPYNNFPGLKVYHTMDYSHKTSECLGRLKEHRIDLLLGYARHDVFCPYFQHFFSDFKGRVLSVPFGHSPRYTFDPNIRKLNKILGTGAINKIIDTNSISNDLLEYKSFFSSCTWAHPIRNTFFNLSQKYPELISSHFSLNKSSKEFNKIDMPKLLGKFDFFINDTTIMDFPPARTYEGIATGSIMIAKQSPSLDALGFQHNINCIFLPHDTLNSEERMVSNLTSILSDTNTTALQKESLKLSSKYTHQNISKELHKEIYAKYQP